MKQETIEELAKNSDKSKCKHFRREHTQEEVYDSFEEGFIEGYQQAEKHLYSEEDMINFCHTYILERTKKGARAFRPEELIKQYKKIEL